MLRGLYKYQVEDFVFIREAPCCCLLAHFKINALL
jgi:hypothetical protein